MFFILKKSLYGLKQTSRQWYKKLKSFILNEDFQKCNVDHCCFFKRYNSNYNNLLLYVDYMLVIGPNMDKIKSLKMQLSKEFNMRDLSLVKILGMQMT